MYAFGCAGITHTRDSRSETNRIIDAARSRVLAEASGLDEASRKAIQATRPKISSYDLSGDGYTQYSIKWLISSNRVISLEGEGVYNRLEGSTIKIRPFNKWYDSFAPVTPSSQLENQP